MRHFNYDTMKNISAIEFVTKEIKRKREEDPKISFEVYLAELRETFCFRTTNHMFVENYANQAIEYIEYIDKVLEIYKEINQDTIKQEPKDFVTKEIKSFINNKEQEKIRVESFLYALRQAIQLRKDDILGEEYGNEAINYLDEFLKIYKKKLQEKMADER